MTHVKIITNNPAVQDAYGGAACFVDGDVSAVFTNVRDAVHLGARLVSHPLSGGVKPWENPYKSVAVSFPENGKGATTDFASLQQIEDAIAALGKGCFNNEKNTADESILDDYRIIDIDLITNAMEGYICPTFTTS
jgi:hypothetical protein